MQCSVRYQKSGTGCVANDVHTKHLQTSHTPLFLFHSVTVTNVMIQNNCGEKSIYFILHFHMTDCHREHSMQELKTGTCRQDCLSLYTALLLTKVLIVKEAQQGLWRMLAALWPLTDLLLSRCSHAAQGYPVRKEYYLEIAGTYSINEQSGQKLSQIYSQNYLTQQSLIFQFRPLSQVTLACGMMKVKDL